MFLRLRRLLRLFSRLLVELLQDVKQLGAVLLFLLVLKVEGVVLEELSFACLLIQILRRFSASCYSEPLWLVIIHVDWAWVGFGVGLQLFHVESLEGKRTNQILFIHESLVVRVLTLLLVLLLNHRSESHLLEQCVFILDRLVKGSLLVGLFQKLFFLVRFLLAASLDHLLTLEDKRVVLLNRSLKSLKQIFRLQILAEDLVESQKFSSVHIFLKLSSHLERLLNYCLHFVGNIFLGRFPYVHCFEVFRHLRSPIVIVILIGDA